MTYREKLEKIWNEFPELRHNIDAAYNYIHQNGTNYDTIRFSRNNKFEMHCADNSKNITEEEIEISCFKLLKETWSFQGVRYYLNNAICMVRSIRYSKSLLQQEGFDWIFNKDFLTEDESNIKDILE